MPAVKRFSKTELKTVHSTFKDPKWHFMYEGHFFETPIR